MNDNIDGGPIFCQRTLEIDYCDYSIRSFYDYLNTELSNLFEYFFDKFLNKKITPYNQPLGGSIHTMKMQKPLQYFIDTGLDVPLNEMIPALKRMLEN